MAGIWIATAADDLLPETEYRLSYEHVGMPVFYTGEDLYEAIEAQTPVVNDSVFKHKGKNQLRAGCGGAGNHRQSEVEWSGNAPVYELAVTHEGKESLVMSNGPMVGLGWSVPCTFDFDLEKGDELSVQIRGWYWDGSHSEWSDEAELDTVGECGCSQTGGSGASYLLLFGIAGLVFRRMRA